MQARTTPPDAPRASQAREVIEKEVETVRTRQHVGGVSSETVPAPGPVAGERSGGYFETLPERLGAVGFAMMTALEGLLGMRVLLRAFNANPDSGFVGFIYDISWPFARPFANVFSDRSWGDGVAEVSTLVAMGVYFLCFAFVGMLVTALAPRLRGGRDGAA